MQKKHGNLSINSDNIFPVIKKWLYSDHDIFFRELISNGCDAVTKLKKLDMMGEYEIPSDNQFKIRVLVNDKNKTIKFIDNGLGMTEEEVNEYINQIAFSGAESFLEKYKDKTNEDQIIGHFGLGFYSAFMVADKVTIDTLSFKEGSKPVFWECDGATEYDMNEGTKMDRGTEITLYLNEDSLLFANEFKAEEIIKKYCSFMPVEIYLETENAVKEEKEVTENENEEVNAEEVKEEKKALNDTVPLWTKHPNECSEEDYKNFYVKVFKDYKEPLFWIHLNMDYPFNLKGILYFPKFNTEYDTLEGTIKLYNNQVFVADNIKEVIPEYLMLLKGVIDCPDLPLNVSRSALQNDGFVKKISDYISKKVADKLSGMCKTEKESYEKYWDDLNPFIKFGCLKDEKFSEKMTEYILFKDIHGKYLTLTECLEENKEHHENTIFYVSDEIAQGQYVKMFKAENINAVVLKHSIDNPFISHLEQKNADIKFMRIDADLTEKFKAELNDDEKKELEEANTSLSEIFRRELAKENLTVKVEKLKNDTIASMVTLSEESRRMQEMMKMYGMMGMDPSMFSNTLTLVLNIENPLVKYILENKDGEHTRLFCKQLYDLAVLSHEPLSPDEMSDFVERSNKIMMLLVK